ncbi:hypothetical protein EVJ50_03945 [Synechococcus sp. RSCCF101]|uniref:hypothetical protein n=1 Tax=Synechococcus sp. RSCCF101 TaxID=2511069 RepID=UPI001248E7EE|nr:hypothetical protein [Synechococcus sp. RSCCF101]QEY31529.1 hypothetical protein EVJ50_03945 [Synechococcus sp. RSCCF101]
MGPSQKQAMQSMPDKPSQEQAVWAIPPMPDKPRIRKVYQVHGFPDIKKEEDAIACAEWMQIARQIAVLLIAANSSDSDDDGSWRVDLDDNDAWRQRLSISELVELFIKSPSMCREIADLAAKAPALPKSVKRLSGQTFNYTVYDYD